MIEQALNPNEVHAQEGADWEFYSSIQPEKELLWDMLYSLNNQLVDIQRQISEMEFAQFMLQSRFAAEDQAAAEQDLDRQRGWQEDAQAEADALQEEREGYVTGTEEETGEPIVAQENRERYN